MPNWNSSEEDHEHHARAAAAAAACPHCASTPGVAPDHEHHHPTLGDVGVGGLTGGAPWTMGNTGGWGNPGGSEGGGGSGFSRHLGHLGPPILSRQEQAWMAAHPGEHYPVHHAPHVGKGPKGYRRSDERIHEEVCEALAADGHVDAREITVAVKDGEVTLSGVVDNRVQKRRAEQICDWCIGVKDVHNGLRIAAHEHADSK